jgi:hypothetical protein
MHSTPAALAPQVTPITSGLASGLRRSRWKSAPDIPNAIPDSSPVTARGRRGWVMT